MLPKILRSDARIRALDDLTTEELNALREAIKSLDVMDVDHVHESFLPWLAWWFRAEQWDDKWSIKQKRASVKDALVLFRFKGTTWAVERALNLSSLESEIILWHEKTPVAQNGTFTVSLPVNKISHLIDKPLQNTIASAIERNKRGSQHWDVRFEVNDEVSIYLGAYKTAIHSITIGPKPPQSNVNGCVKVAPYVTVYEDIEIPAK
ncbi:phage tail protein I [Vibrio sp. OPT18]|uniref:phage tail protein I n=1 Tax=Vibrio sp. OPT18 TaxID=2778641 RepID=UPI0018811CF1|nr:phage tail protein I [Vibrio sp. OPT18]MBE8578658.1 phage tail protein I [Vibrio sp. OPT18]